VDRVSVVINTLNEEKNLPTALASVEKFFADLPGQAGEIVVVDMHSEDATVEIAKKAGAKVFTHNREGYVEPARNFAINKASGDWILILDADEKISSSLSKKLKKIINNSDAQYFRLPRKNIIFGKWIKYSGWWPDYNIRFFKKGYVEWNEIIHSVPITKGKGADLEANKENAIIHNHYETIEQYVNRLNRYTTYHAKNINKRGYVFKWRHLITKPSDEFLSRYFGERGHKDGVHGLALSLLQAFSELVLYLKLWQLGGFQRQTVETGKVIGELKSAQKNANYWYANTLFVLNGEIIQRLKRKFKLP
jgi:glycosyltransferase involved in cell wall biosynthesis